MNNDHIIYELFMAYEFYETGLSDLTKSGYEREWIKSRMERIAKEIERLQDNLNE